jgi:hypothetical protein
MGRFYYICCMEPIKPHDIIVLLKVLLKGESGWKYEQLEEELGFSKSVVFRSLSRCAKAKFISPSPFDFFFTSNLLEFLQHGIQYAFAVEPGKMSKGIPTAHSAPVLNKQIIAENDQYIWPDANGSVRGQVIEPLDKRVAEIIKNDPELYDLLALIDAVRVGKNREKEIAGRLLKEKIQSHAVSYQ